MIDGFKVSIDHDELKAHLIARAEHHRQRAREKEAELPNLQAALEKIKNVPIVDPAQVVSAANTAWLNETGGGAMFGYRLNVDDVLRTLQNDIKGHRDKAATFAFFADHLHFEDYYFLYESELLRLEFIRR